MKEEHLSSAAPTREPFKDVLLRNLDMIAAGVGVILLALHLFGVVLGTPADLEHQISELDATLAEVDEHLGDTRFGTDRYQVRVSEVIDEVRRTFGKLPVDTVTGKPDVAFPDALVKQARAGESNSMSFFAPQDVRGEARFGANRIEWTAHEDNNVPLSGFRILRREGDRGTPTEVGATDGDTYQYDDADVKPGRSYTYFVVAVTDDPAVADQMPQSPRSLPITLEAVADFKVTLVDADEDTRTATFKVEKWHKETWFSKQFTARVGQIIGENDPGAGIDYTTGRRVKSIEFKDAFEEKTREEVVFGPDAKVQIKDGAPVTETVTVREAFQEIRVAVEGGGLPPKTLTHEKRS